MARLGTGPLIRRDNSNPPANIDARVALVGGDIIWIAKQTRGQNERARIGDANQVPDFPLGRQASIKKQRRRRNDSVAHVLSQHPVDPEPRIPKQAKYLVLLKDVEMKRVEVVSVLVHALEPVVGGREEKNPPVPQCVVDASEKNPRMPHVLKRLKAHDGVEGGAREA